MKYVINEYKKYISINKGRMSMKELMKTNIYDVDETIIIVGSCLKYMQPERV